MEIDEALATAALVATGAMKLNDRQARRWLNTLQAATRPRVLWPAKEVGEYLGVKPENLRPQNLRGLPEPAQVFPRPTKSDPDREMRMWWADEIEDFKPELDARRAERERT